MPTKAAKATKSVKKSTKKKGLTARQELERTRLDALIEGNEERLKAGTTAKGDSLTEKQIETTRQILTTQREKLAELEALLDS